MKHYILDENKEPVETDFLEAAKWFEDIDKRRVAHHQIGKIAVSTVFLTFDHGTSFYPHTNHKPVLFETMTFPDETQERYCTYKEALAGHYRHCTRIWGPDWRKKFDDHHQQEI